jgi:hypothetical protein
MTKSRWASVSTMVASEVDWAIMAMVKITISRAGSARKPISISRRPPSVPKEVPMSMPASEMKMRARPKTPTSAMVSAAGANGRSVDSVGMMAQASTMQPNMTKGAARNSGEALCASTTSLWNSLCSM